MINSKYVVLEHPTCPVFTDQEIDDIFEIFSIPVAESSVYFQFDYAMVKQFIFSRDKSERSQAMSIILDFPSLIDEDSEKSDFGTSLRQLVAIGYFMPQLIRSNNYQFLKEMLATFRKMIEELNNSHNFFKQYTTSLSFVLSKLTKRMIDVDITSPIYRVYQDVIDTSLELYKNKEMITEREIPKFLPFFFNCLFTFRGDTAFNPDQSKILSNLLHFLNRFMTKANNCKLNYIELMHHCLHLLISNPLNVKSKSQLFNLLVCLSARSREVSSFIYDPTNAAFIVIYIITSLKLIKFDFDQSKCLKPTTSLEKLNFKYDVVQNKIDRTFDENFPVYSESERKKFYEKFEISIKSPECVTSNRELNNLILSLNHLCDIRSKALKVQFNADFMKEVVLNAPLTSLPVFPFFLSSWLCQFIELDIAPVSVALHQMNFYTTLLDMAFLKYNDQTLRDFIIDLIILLSDKYRTKEPYFLSDLMLFTCLRIEDLDVDQQLFEGLAKSASKNPSSFVNASHLANFANRLAEYLSEMMAKHSTQKSDRIVKVRTQLLRFIDQVDTFPEIFQYLFEAQNFSLAILGHFYDNSTVNFAANQLLFVFQQFPRKSPVMSTFVKFFESFEVDENLLRILLNCSTSGYEINPLEIAKLFSETNFLDFLVNASMKLNSEEIFYGLVDLFSKMTTNRDYPVYFDVFLRLSNLIPKEIDINILWKVVFEDEKGESEPRKIVNPAPISLIFCLKARNGQIKEFIEYLNQCIKFDPNITYRLSELELSSLILQKINEYRTKTEEDEVFSIAFDLFYELSLRSLKIKDFRSLFRLCASLPDHKRPFFTSKIISTMSDLFIKRMNLPTSFFDLSGENTHLQLPELPVEMINTKGFSLYIDIYFNTDKFNGKIFEFRSPSSKLTFEWQGIETNELTQQTLTELAPNTTEQKTETKEQLTNKINDETNDETNNEINNETNNETNNEIIDEEDSPLPLNNDNDDYALNLTLSNEILSLSNEIFSLNSNANDSNSSSTQNTPKSTTNAKTNDKVNIQNTFKGHFILTLRNDDNVQVFKIEKSLQINCWQTFGVIYHSKQFSIIQNMDSRSNNVFKDLTSVIKYNDFRYTSYFTHFQALVNVPCKVCRIMCPKENLERNIVRCYNLLPKCKPVSFHHSESSMFISFFNPLFTTPAFTNKINYLFYASEVSGKFAVNLVSSTTLRVTGTIYNTEPEPVLILDLIGGISALLPFFGQLDQEIMKSSNDAMLHFDPDFLPNLFNLLTSIFIADEATSIQRSFRKIDGPSILAFLISISSLKHLENENTIESICKLVETIKFIPLVLQMIDHVLFNFKLWLYLPIELQTYAYMKFYETVFKRIASKQASISYAKGFTVSKLLMLMRVYLWDHNSNRKICMVDEPKMDILDKNIEGKRPSDCSGIRNNFWEILKQMCDLSLTDEDISLLISFCCETLDLEFSMEAISLFIYLLQTKNKKVLNYMKRDYAFSSFYNLLKVPNSLTQCKILQIYALLDLNYLKPFSVKYWDSGIVSTISYQTINLEFVKILEKTMIKPKVESVTSREPVKWVLSNPHLIPLFLLSIQQLQQDQKLSYFNNLCSLLLSNHKPSIYRGSNNNSNNNHSNNINNNNNSVYDEAGNSVHWDHPFLLLLMSQLPSVESEINPLAKRCISFLVKMYIISASTTTLQSPTVGPNYNNNISATSYIPTPSLPLSMTPNSSSSSSSTNSSTLSHNIDFFTFMDFVFLMAHKSKHNYVHIIRLIYLEFLNIEDKRIKPTSTLDAKTFHKIYCQIIEFMLSRPKIEISKQSHNDYNYQELFKISLLQNFQSPKFKYGARAVKKDEILIEWNDVLLSKILIQSILDRYEIFSQMKSKEIKPLDMMGIFIKTGLQIPKYINDFMSIADIFLQFVINNHHEDMMQPYRHAFVEVYSGLAKAFEVNKDAVVNYLYTNTVLFTDILLAQFKIVVPAQIDVSNYEQYKDFLNPILEKSILIEYKIKKILKILRSKKEQSISSLALEALGSVQLTKRLKNGEMTEEVALRTTLEQFALTRRQQDTSSIKKYKEIFRTLSSENGPWQTLEVDSGNHRKLKNRINRFCRFFMKPNFNFTDHKTASIARDIGNVQNAQEIYQREFAKLKLTEFKGDLALIAADRHALRDYNTSTEKVIIKLDCRWVTMKQNFSGTLSMIKDALIFDSASKFARISIDSITKVFQRHYLLLDTSIEIYTRQKKSYFFDFSETAQRQLFLQMLNEFKLSNVKFIQLNSDMIQPMIIQTTEKWQKGQLTNFEYLLKINKYSGRSYHDLSQYPVFPWVLQDYESDTLDLNNVKVYRDLSKPIAAFGKDRLDILKERLAASFKNDPDSHYLYGALYSSAAVVIGYLLRMEPFTTLHVTLQSKRFDHADRLFVDIPRAWESVTTSSMDFRELIPEFFYFPDFLINENKLDLGVMTKTGQTVNDVILPKWAKSPSDFVAKNREALESPFVTMNLHKWIDLVFGPKSRPPLSEKFDNLFHPYFYETATEGRTGKQLDMVREYAACFGEVPLQIFFEEPQQKSISPRPFLSSFANIDTTRAFKIIPNNRTANQIGVETSEGIARNNSSKKIVSISCENGHISALDCSLNFYTDFAKGQLKLNIPSELEDICIRGQKIAISLNSAIVTLPWDSALYFFKLSRSSNNKLEPTIINRLHNMFVTAIDMNDHYAVTGSKDSTLRIWEIKKNNSLFKNSKITTTSVTSSVTSNINVNTNSTTSSLSLSNAKEMLKPINVVAKHQTAISLVCLNQKLRICSSISTDGFIMVTSLISGEFVCGTRLNYFAEPSTMSISDLGSVIVAMNASLNESKVFVLDQNLRQINEKRFDISVISTAVVPWNDGIDYIAAAMGDGTIHFFILPYLDELKMSISIPYEVTKIAYLKEDKSIIVGDVDGEIHTYRFID